MDSWTPEEITPETIARFAKVHGERNCKRIMHVMGKKQPFYHAVSSEIGRELLTDIMLKMEVLLEKQINDDPQNPMSDSERAEYRVYKHIAEKWASKIEKYLMLNKKLKRG